MMTRPSLSMTPLRIRSAVRNRAKLRLRFIPPPHPRRRHRMPLWNAPQNTRKSIVIRRHRRLSLRCPRPNPNNTRALSQ
jgi:hypothetical protein